MDGNWPGMADPGDGGPLPRAQEGYALGRGLVSVSADCCDTVIVW